MLEPGYRLPVAVLPDVARLATSPDWVAEFSLAGALSKVAPLGTWWATVPVERWPDHPQAREYLERHWQEPFGDRRQELVFIGTAMDKAAMCGALDAALIGPDNRYDPAQFSGLPDPFPAWRRAQAA